MDALRRRAFHLILGLLLLFILGEGYVWSRAPDGYLHLWIRAAGDGFIARTPAGHLILVDGPGDVAAAEMWLALHLPPTRRTLDALILTRGDRPTALAQEAVARRYPPHRAWAPAHPPSSPEMIAWEDAVPAALPLRQGLTLDVAGLLLEVGNPDPPLLHLRFGRLHVAYAPQPPSADRALSWAQATLGIARRLPDPGVPLPRYLFLPGAAVSPGRGENLLRADVTLLVPPDSARELHIVTDGVRWYWTWE